MDLLSLSDLKSNFNEFIGIVTDFIGQQQWLAIFILLLISFILERISIFFFKKVLKITRKTKTDLDDRIIAKSSRPIGNYILLLGLYIIVQIFKFPGAPVDIKSIILTGVKIAVVINTIWLLIRLTDVFGKYLFSKAAKTRSRLDDQLIPIFQKTIRVFLYAICIIYIIQAMGYSISGIVAGLGIGGLAVALAAKDTLANLFGSITLITDRPFRVGDWIRVGDDEGYVEQIGFRSTRIRTFPKTQITIPNSIIANTSINNFSRMPKRRVKMTVGVTYETSADQMEAVVNKIRDLLGNHSEVDQEFSIVNFTDFGASSLDILVYYFTKSTKWAHYLQVRQGINLSIMRIIEESGLSIAFPTRTVYLKTEDKEDIQG